MCDAGNAFEIEIDSMSTTMLKTETKERKTNQIKGNQWFILTSHQQSSASQLAHPNVEWYLLKIYMKIEKKKIIFFLHDSVTHALKTDSFTCCSSMCNENILFIVLMRSKNMIRSGICCLQSDNYGMGITLWNYRWFQ